MSRATLASFGVTTPDVGEVDQQESSETTQPLLGFQQPDPATLPAELQDAREADWVVYTGRYPHVFDAARFGFGIGHREDSSYQWTPEEVDLPVHFLDNDYRDAELDRFVDRILEYEPEIAVLGDIYHATELDRHLEAARRVWAEFPDIELILVPKCNEVLNEIPEDFVLGFPNGTSDVQALDIATYREWRNLPHRIHILGGTPLSTHDHIVELTRETVTGAPRADIAGVDWNGYQLYAENHGDYADADGGWHRNLREEYPAKRDLIRYSLLNAKHFWVSRGVWPGVGDVALPDRDDLRAANNGGPINLDEQTDCRELFISPLPDSDRRSQPIYRTDDTQTEIIEPLSPAVAFLSSVNGEAWEPAGALSQSVEYRAPSGHRTDLVCSGCGAHILAETERCNVESHQETATVQVVSYEHQSCDRDEDYGSVAADGPETLEARTTFPAIHCFCSDSCRRRAEHRSPHELLDVDHHEASAHPDGKLVGKLSLHLSE